MNAVFALTIRLASSHGTRDGSVERILPVDVIPKNTAIRS